MKLVLVFPLAFLLGAGSLFLWNDYSHDLKPSTTQTVDIRKTLVVKHDAIKMEEIPRIHEAAGQITSSKTIDLSSRVSGYISSLIPAEGEIVQAGSILIEIDSTKVESSILQTKASLEQAMLELEDAQTDVKRFRELIKTNFISEERFRKANLRVVRAKTAIDKAKAELNGKKSELAYAKIKSPTRARILEHLSKPGDLAVPGVPILRIEALGQLRFETWVPISINEQISIGQSILLELDGKLNPINAVVTEIVRSADPVTQRYKVRLGIPENTALMVGHYGTAKFKLGVDNLSTVNNKALIQRAGIDGVFIIDSTNKARFRTVRLGRNWNGRRELLAGPEADSITILSPPKNLRDGDSVTYAATQ